MNFTVDQVCECVCINPLRRLNMFSLKKSFDLAFVIVVQSSLKKSFDLAFVIVVQSRRTKVYLPLKFSNNTSS